MAAPVRYLICREYLKNISKRIHASSCFLRKQQFNHSNLLIYFAQIHPNNVEMPIMSKFVYSPTWAYRCQSSTQMFRQGLRSVTRSPSLILTRCSHHSEQSRFTRQSQGHGSTGNAALALGIGGFMLCSAALAFSFWQDDNKNTIEKVIARAVIAERENRLGDVESLYHQAAVMCREENNSQALLYTYDQMANFNMRHGRLIKAESLFKETLRLLLSSGMPREDPGVVEISLKLARIYERMGRNEEAETGFRWCIETSEKLIKEMADDSSEESHTVMMNVKSLLGMCLDSFARFLGATNRLADAEQYYKRALAICEQDLMVEGMPHPQTVVLLNDLGTICDMRGHYDEAAGYVQRAYQLAERVSPAVLPTILCNLASIEMHRGKKEDAADRYRTALKLAEMQGDNEAAIIIRANLQKLS